MWDICKSVCFQVMYFNVINLSPWFWYTILIGNEYLSEFAKSVLYKYIYIYQNN